MAVKGVLDGFRVLKVDASLWGRNSFDSEDV
jgi:hypothetical protein